MQLPLQHRPVGNKLLNVKPLLLAVPLQLQLLSMMFKHVLLLL